jgi:hypothetical protein
MNPNYLLMDELLYELGLRRVTSELEIHSLRKLFRSVAARDIPVEVGYLKSVSEEELYERLLSKILELQNFINKPETELSDSASRIHTKLLHLRGRVSHLQLLGQWGSKVDRAGIQGLEERLEAMEQQVVSVSDPERRDGTVGDITSRDSGSTQGASSNLTTAEVHRSVVQDTIQVTTPDLSNTQAFHSSLYQKLPHPLGPLLKELTNTDWSSIPHLWDFLLKIIRIRQVGLIEVPTIYELMYPYCRGEALALLTQALVASEPFDAFHARFLKRFIPARQFSHLRFEKYERVQREGESLAKYIQAVRDAALILWIVETEAQVVERIVEGLTPTQRARFVFQAPPTNYTLLE